MAIVKLADILFDAETQPRVRMDLPVVQEYADAMAAGDKFPPVLLFEEDGGYWIADGFHRCEAARRIGLNEIAAEVKPGTKRDAILASCGANALHGLRRTNDDKGRAVDRLLADEEWAQWPDDEVAKYAAVHRTTVLRHRSILCNAQDSRLVKRGDSTYLMNTAAIGAGLTAEALSLVPQTDLQRNQKDLKRVERMPTELQVPILNLIAEGKATGSAIKQVLAEQQDGNTQLPPLPEAKFRCLVIDPPWPVQKIEREERPNQAASLDYPVMTLEQIGLLPVSDLAADNGCHLYLWVTQKYLPDGLRLCEEWGFKYQCLMTWVKPTGFTPYSWMYNTEHVIFARSGGLGLAQLGLKLSFEAPVTRHSEKPPIFYERVIAATPGPRLEMFARSSREGFVAWGNEAVGVA